MEGPSPAGVRPLPLTRAAESSRLQLEHVRHAFELLVPHSQRSIDCPSPTPRPRPAVAVEAGPVGE